MMAFGWSDVFFLCVFIIWSTPIAFLILNLVRPRWLDALGLALAFMIYPLVMTNIGDEFTVILSFVIALVLFNLGHLIYELKNPVQSWFNQCKNVLNIILLLLFIGAVKTFIMLEGAG